MKRTILMSSLALALMAGSFIASAQTPTTGTAPPAATPAPAGHTDPSDPSKGQELTGDQKQQPADAPASVGQNKATGNNLVGKNEAKMDGAAQVHPSFQTMDVKKQGYLTVADASGHEWLTKNFARCNSSHDGRLTAKEYEACLK